MRGVPLCVEGVTANPNDRSDPNHAWLERLHLWGATFGIALQPLSTATGNVGFGVAIACMLPRSPRLVRDLRELAGRSWARLLIAWIAWSLFSLIWSPDPKFGIEQFKAARVLLWIPVLWPIRSSWRQLVGAILLGSAVMAILQATQVGLGWPRSKFTSGAGLTTPTQTGLWDAVALSYWLIIAVSARPLVAVATLPLAMLSGVGLAWSATRASTVGLLVEFLVANVVLAITSRGWLARAVLRCLAGLLILGAAVMFAGSHLQSKMSKALHVMESSEHMTSDVRLSMWKVAVDGWKQSPIAGLGIGSIPSIMAKTTVTNPKINMHRVRMVHNTYLQALTETGVVGLALLLGFIGLLFRDVLSRLRDQPMLVASFGALLVWTVAAAFDGYQQSGGFLTVGAILIPLALADERPRDAA